MAACDDDADMFGSGCSKHCCLYVVPLAFAASVALFLLLLLLLLLLLHPAKQIARYHYPLLVVQTVLHLHA